MIHSNFLRYYFRTEVLSYTVKVLDLKHTGLELIWVRDRTSIMTFWRQEMILHKNLSSYHLCCLFFRLKHPWIEQRNERDLFNLYGMECMYLMCMQVFCVHNMYVHTDTNLNIFSPQNCKSLKTYLFLNTDECILSHHS